MGITMNSRPQTENLLDTFIKGWGRMGVYWGVGKVTAEIQALLYLSHRPLSLDEMAERLKTSRSNISLNVRILQDLGVVRKVHAPGDRKNYYQADADLPGVARRLAAAKKKRELDPALDVVRRAIEAANAARSETGGGGGDGGSANVERLYELKGLIEKIGDVFDAFIDAEPSVSPRGARSERGT
jgi:DNA-binding transcriptional regulator GbsR (MarR family)